MTGMQTSLLIKLLLLVFGQGFFNCGKHDLLTVLLHTGTRFLRIASRQSQLLLQQAGQRCRQQADLATHCLNSPYQSFSIQTEQFWPPVRQQR